VRETNPELARARELGLTVLHRSEALAALMADRDAVAVAGAHGKTTTSAMVATILRELGEDPSFAVGGSVLTDDGALPGGHLGSGDVLVAEADESDGSFLAYAPTVALVTNVEPDHLDHYGTREAFDAEFVAFAGRVVEGGALVACADDPGSAALAARHRAGGGTAWTYGTDPASDLVVQDVRTADGASAVLRVRAAGLGGQPALAAGATAPLTLRVPGAHNVLNAAGAVLACVALGARFEAAAAAAAAFRGTGRRFEPRGEAAGVRVVDDYAHHPTEITALLTAARGVAGDGRLVVLFQPHLYSRTRTFAREFAGALGLADEVVVTGVYAAREDPDPATTARTVTDLLPATASGAAPHAVEDRLEAARTAAGLASPGDLLLTVGAGDVTELGAVVLDALRTRAGE